MVRIITWILLFKLISIFTSGFSQNCGCDIVIQPNDIYLDGGALGIKPGDVICVMASTKPYLGFVNFHGEPGNPITIINCGGQVQVGNSGFYYGIRFDNCSYFKFTGTGDPSVQYGFKTLNTIDGTMGVIIDMESTDFEVDNIEISESGFAGIMAKSDPDCSDKNVRGKFLMKNVSIHDNYIHDTKGEGMYIGFPHYSGIYRICGSNNDTILKLPHDINGLRIFRNKIENTGREGMQIGCATADVEIFENHISNFGFLRQKYNNSGVQIATGTVGRFYSNVINGGSGPGIWLKGMGDNYIYNNLIVNFGDDGFMVHDSIMNPDAGYYIINNTIANGGRYGLRFYTENNTKVNFGNNIITGLPHSTYFSNSIVEKHNNVYRKSIKAMRFKSYGTGDFQLKATSPAVDAGYDYSDLGIINDLEYDNRPQAKAYDAGAFESPYERIYDIFQVNPNPIMDTAAVVFIVLDDMKVSVKVYDELGRVVGIIAEGDAIGGDKYIFRFSFGYLAQGMYFVALETEESRQVLKVIRAD